MNFSKSLIVALALFGMLFSASNAWSAFEIHPYLTLEEEYNDNIFLSPENEEEEDWITTVEPGISLSYDNRSIAATVNYSLRYRFYKDHEDENLDKFKDVQRADAIVLFFSGRPFTLRLSETISRETIDERDDNEFTDIENRSTVYHTSAVPEYRWQLTPTFSLIFGYSYDRNDYIDPRGNDSEEHEGRFSVVKQLSSTTEVFARYAYTVHQSDADEDEFDRQDYVLGLTQQLGGRTAVSFEGGYSDIEYDSGFETDATNWLVDISYHLSEPMTLSLGYSQDFTTTVEDGLTETQEASFGVDYEKELLTVATELFWNNSEYVRLDREDEAYGVRFDLSSQLTRAFSATMDAEYEQAEYDDSGVNEEVDRLTVGASFGYEYRRFLASLGYRYRINDSDIEVNDYTNNIVTLSATVRF